jgi:C1A family cysteine protease
LEEPAAQQASAGAPNHEGAAAPTDATAAANASGQPAAGETTAAGSNNPAVSLPDLSGDPWAISDNDPELRAEAVKKIEEFGGEVSGDAVTFAAYSPVAEAVDVSTPGLPAAYDVRETNPAGVTPLRDQGRWGTCGEFAMATSIEWSIAKNGAVSVPTQISAAFLAQVGDEYSFRSPELATINEMGGLQYSRFYGARRESAFPYQAYSPPSGSEPADKAWRISPDQAATSEFHFRNRLSYGERLAVVGGDLNTDALESVKRMVHNHGVVSVVISSTALDEGRWGGLAVSYEGFFPIQNHAVAIIGWDDSLPKEYFVVDAPGDGAFLVKNSWGMFHWVSYYDTSLGSFTYWDFGGTDIGPGGDGIEHVYYHDNPSSDGSGLRHTQVFTVPTDGYAQVIRALQVGTQELNSAYTVRLLRGVSQDGQGGQPQPIGPNGETEITESQRFSGSHRLNLPTTVQLSRGERFAVTVEYDRPQGADASGVSRIGSALQAYSSDALPQAAIGQVGLPETAVVGTSITPTVMGVSPANAVLTYQWFQDGDPVAGATSARFTPLKVGATYSVRVGAGAAGFLSAAAHSGEAIGNNAGTKRAFLRSVAIVGVPRPGNTLRAVSGDRIPAAASLDYVWTIGEPYGGAVERTATGPNYLLTSADAGKEVGLVARPVSTGWESTCKAAGDVSCWPSASVLVPSGAAAVERPVLTYTSLEPGGIVSLAAPVTAWPKDAGVAWVWWRDRHMAGERSLSQEPGPYTLTEADAGHTVSLEVRASKLGYQRAFACSEPLHVGTLRVSEVTVTGAPLVGSALTAWISIGGGFTVTAVSYQWYRDGEPITSGTTQSYRPVQADVGHAITVRGTGSREGWAPDSKLSLPVVIQEPAAIDGVEIVGTPEVYSALVAQPVGVRPSSTTVSSVVWRRSDGTNRSYDLSFRLSAADAGLTLYAEITVSGPYGSRATARSEPVTVTWAVPRLERVLISGSLTPGRYLLAEYSPAAPTGSTVVYQWYADGEAVGAVTSSGQRQIGPDTADKEITVRVKITNPAGASAELVSEPVRTEALAPSYVNLRGNPLVGTRVEVVTQTNAYPVPSGLQYHYSWLLDGVTPICGDVTRCRMESGWVGRALSVTVTVSGGGYPAASMTSEAVLVAEAASIGSVTIEGQAVAGGVVTAKSTGVVPASSPLEVAWLINGEQVAMGEALVIPGAWCNKRVAARVTVIGPYETRAQATSSWMVITCPSPRIDRLIIKPNTPYEHTMMAEVDGVLPAGAQVRYEWFRDGVKVPNTSPEMQFSRDDLGVPFVVRVTVTTIDGQIATAESEPLAPEYPFSFVGKIVIEGVRAPGNVLTAVISNVRPEGTTVRYQWWRDLREALTSTSDSPTYTVRDEDAGHRLTVMVLTYYPGMGWTNYQMSVNDIAHVVEWDAEPPSFSDIALQVEIPVRSTCAEWRVSSGAAWLSVPAPNGSKSQSITVKAAANTSTSAREATLTVAGCDQSDVITVRQAARATAISLNPGSWAAAPNGGSTTLTVTTNQPEIQVSYSADWLLRTVNAAPQGSYVNLTAAPNPGSSRSVTVTVTAGSRSATFRVTQAAGTLELSPASWSAAKDGDSRAVRVTTNLGTWAAAPGADWITVAPSQGATGESFTVSAQPNPGAARKGEVTVTVGAIAKVLTVSQAAATLTSSPGSWSPGYAGASTAIEITASVGQWRLDPASVPDWLEAAPAPGQARPTEGQQVVKAVRNDGAARAATLVFKAGDLTREVTVRQAAAPTASVTLSPTSWSAPGDAGAIAVTVNANRAVRVATADQPWLHLLEGSRSSEEPVFVVADRNTTGATRTGTVTVTVGTASRVLKVTQAPGSKSAGFTASLPGWLTSEAQTSQRETGLGGISDKLTVSDDASWLTATVASGTGLVSMTVTANKGETRKALVSVKSGSKTLGTFLVLQAGVPELTAGSATWSVAASGGNASRNVSVQGDRFEPPLWSASVSGGGSWLHVTPGGSRSGTNLVLAADPNLTGAARTAVVKVTAGGALFTLTVTQRG